jgi:hypothetical protein
VTEAPQTVEDVDVDALAGLIGAGPSVARLGGPWPGAAATYLPGRRVPGLRIAPDRVGVEVVARWGYPVADVVAEIRRAAATVVPGRRVDVTVADVELPGSEQT